METARYRAFLASAESGSFTRAAELLGYTPSGVSQLVSALERELGFSLLLRGKKGVRLSTNGETLLPMARELLRQEDRLRQTAAEINGLAMGSVTVGSFSSIASHWLPPLIKAFQSDYPHIQIRIMQGVRQEILEWLDERRIDLAFLSYQEPMDYEWVPLREDPMLAVLPRSHPLAGAAAYPLERCPEEAFIMPAMGKDDDVNEMFRQNRVKPNIAYYTVENYPVLAMIESGMGMSIMNQMATRNWQCDVAMLPVDPPQKITLGMAAHSLREAPPAVRRFAAYAVQQLTRPEAGSDPARTKP